MFNTLYNSMFILAASVYNNVFNYADSMGDHVVEYTSGHGEMYIFFLYPVFFMFDTLEPIINYLAVQGYITETWFPVIELLGFIFALQIVAMTFALWFWAIYTLYLILIKHSLKDYVALGDIFVLITCTIWVIIFMEFFSSSSSSD